MRVLIMTLAMIGLATAPATASVRDAAFSSSSDRLNVQASVFAGASYRVGLDRRTGGPRGQASLKLSGMTKASDTSVVRFGQGLEIIRGEAGAPGLYLAGQDVGELKSKAQLKGTGTALIIGGVVLLAVAVALVASDIHHKNKCSEEEDC